MITISTVINNCLELFQLVPVESLATTELNEAIPLIQYGIILHPEVLTYKKEIESYLQDTYLTGNDLNKSFHKSWETIIESTEEELLAQQLLHYFSTYGLQDIGLYSQDSIYIPNEELDIPLPLIFKVIRGITPDKIINKCKSLLESGIALKQETIIKILDILQGLNYPLVEVHSKNKEASILIIDRIGKLPDKGDELFRYLYYKATGGLTLVIKSKEAKSLINSRGYELPLLTDTQKIQLAQSFNRYKDLWLSIKLANKTNVSTVNRIAKLSKNHHKPMRPDVLNSLTSMQFPLSIVKEAASSVNIFRLIRTINAIRFYMEERQNRTYLIRNGKSYTKVKSTVNEEELLLSYHELLIDELKGRLKTHSIYYPTHIDYALPTSEKSFLGNVPIGTIITLPKTEDTFLIGIYWEGDMVDLDLRADSLTESVGWNTSIKGEGLLHSGDITSAPNGATEWLYTRKIEDVYDIKVNGYSGTKDGDTFKLILGYGDTPDKNYIINPNKVLYQTDMNLVQRQMNIGLLESNGGDLKFYIGGMGTGNGRVGRFTKLTEVMNKATIAKNKSALRLSNLIPSTEKGEVDLSPSKLSKDSLIGLFL